MDKLFGGPGAGQEALRASILQAEIMQEFFHKMANTCGKKCVPSAHNADLSVGEATCIDRCTGKYMHGQQLVGEAVQKFEADMQRQQQAQQQLGGGPR
jgi:import inner membrane translocase subunit TIM10